MARPPHMNTSGRTTIGRPYVFCLSCRTHEGRIKSGLVGMTPFPKGKQRAIPTSGLPLADCLEDIFFYSVEAVVVMDIIE
jgi:hypothetical protein